MPSGDSTNLHPDRWKSVGSESVGSESVVSHRPSRTSRSPDRRDGRGQPLVAAMRDSGDADHTPNRRVLGPAELHRRRRRCVPSPTRLLPSIATHQRSGGARRVLGEHHDSGLRRVGRIESRHCRTDETAPSSRASRRDHDDRRRADSRERSTLPLAGTRSARNCIRRRSRCCQHRDFRVVDRDAVHRSAGSRAGVVPTGRQCARGFDAGPVRRRRTDNACRFAQQGPRPACIPGVGVRIPGSHLPLDPDRSHPTETCLSHPGMSVRATRDRDPRPSSC